MTFEQLVDGLREVYEYADARNIFGHIAIQINIEGKGHGVCYLEVADRAVCVEPYDYYDNDGVLSIDSEAVLLLIQGKIRLIELLEQKRARFNGNKEKMNSLLNTIF